MNFKNNFFIIRLNSLSWQRAHIYTAINAKLPGNVRIDSLEIYSVFMQIVAIV